MSHSVMPPTRGALSSQVSHGVQWTKEKEAGSDVTHPREFQMMKEETRGHRQSSEPAAQDDMTMHNHPWEMWKDALHDRYP